MQKVNVFVFITLLLIAIQANDDIYGIYIFSKTITGITNKKIKSLN